MDVGAAAPPVAGDGYWGPITSSTEWCESNYAVSPYIAEFYNTISNVVFIAVAAFGFAHTLRQGFEKRFLFLYASCAVIGCGSALFHATLQHAQQQSDETPMVWGMLLYMYVLFSPHWHYTTAMPTFLALYGTAFAVIHARFRFVTLFQLHYVLLCLLCAPRWLRYYRELRDPAARQLAHWYGHTLALGTACWLADRHLCDRMQALPVNPQGHAWWHVFMSLNSYLGIAFLQFCRAEQLDWRPEVRYYLLLPYIHIHKKGGAAGERRA